MRLINITDEGKRFIDEWENGKDYVVAIHQVQQERQKKSDCLKPIWHALHKPQSDDSA